MMKQFPYLKTIAEKAGTPVYVYSKDILLKNIALYKEAFPDGLICYALKANSNTALCRIMANRGIGADVVSGGELWRALKAGFRPEHIVFSGTGKTPEEISLAVKSGILMLNA